MPRSIEVLREARSRASVAILHTDAPHASGSTLDLAAVVAFIGLTVGELIVVWVVSIFRREPA